VLARGHRSASDLVRLIEDRLRSAAQLRAEAERLRQAADRVEDEAREEAEAAFGQAHASMALAIASLSVAGSEAAVHLSPGVLARAVPSADGPRRPSFDADPDQAADEERMSLLGVEFPVRRRAEAEEIVRLGAEAGRSSEFRPNPYAGNRGKNAWRPRLFETAAERSRTESRPAPTTFGFPSMSSPVPDAARSEGLNADEGREGWIDHGEPDVESEAAGRTDVQAGSAPPRMPPPIRRPPVPGRP
jgi:hypothetical protein